MHFKLSIVNCQSSILLIGTLLLLSTSCSTKKNTWTSRAYHNVNAEFNVMFNGRESFKEGVKKADTYLPQDYSQMPPVFSYEYNDIPGKVSGEMDRTIQKCDKLVLKHSITAKPKDKPGSGASKKERDFYNQTEFCAVVDDALLLNGKARMYLHEYDKAAQIFDHIVQEYPKSSAAVEAKIQLAGALIRTGELERAQRILQEASKNKELPKKLKILLDAMSADLFIQQKNYNNAAAHLESALRNGAKKADKIRYYFILAELYGRMGGNLQAVNYLNKAIKLNPPYNVVFAAQMRKAALYDPKTQHLNIRQDLQNMLKDEKNAEFKDQIYYALGLVEKAYGHDSLAIDYLRKSVETESSNEMQHGLSYMLLGDYAYAAKQYINAYTDYNNALHIFGHDYAQYETLQKKVDGLQKLAENYRIIKTEDSLRRLAAMPTYEREKWITAEIAKVTEQEKQAQQDQRQQQYQMYQQERNVTTGADSRSNSWYFYNPSALNAGLSSFNMRWGRRKLEDDWRRKNKQVIANITADVNTADSSTTEQVMSNKTREYYTRNLPLTPEAMAASNDRLSSALFKLGEAYKDDVHEPQSAIGTFRELDRRFSSNTNNASVYYYLYQLYNEVNKPDSAEYYKRQLIQRYPKGPLAQQLSNPNYFAEQRAEQAKIEALYEKVFEAYNALHYVEADALAQQLMQQYPNSLLQPQLEFIRALCAGAGGNQAAYTAALDNVVKQYPTSDVATKATEILAVLRKPATIAAPADSAALVVPKEPTTDISFVVSDGVHYPAFICEQKANTAGLLFVLESYNADTYLDKNLEVAVRNIGDNYAIVIVRSFGTKLDAREYAEGLQQRENILKNFPPTEFRRVLISSENLDLLVQSKDVAAYLKFYALNY